MPSSFDPAQQAQNIDAKLIFALEKVSQVYRTLLWQTQKETGLSPLQSQMLLFMLFHDESIVSISNFATEFSVTKATVSDAFKTLIKKELVYKEPDPLDKRRQLLKLTKNGVEIATSIQSYTAPLESSLGVFSLKKKEQLFGSLKSLLINLNDNHVISPLRMCTTCRHYSLQNRKPYCGLMEKTLQDSEIRLDCAEHEIKE